MIISSIILLILSNAVNIRRDLPILYNRIAILILIYCIMNDFSSLNVITKGIGLHGGLLLITNISQIFHIFIFIISILILTLTSFYPRKVWISKYSSLTNLLVNKFIYYNTKIINKMAEHFKITEYPNNSLGGCINYRGKLPNSGEALKLLIPNLDEYFRGGWINYSCRVTSQKIFEKGMGNRGSMSKKGNIFFVKEQRVDGSYIGYTNRPMLRCTLRGFERITCAGIPSNQTLNKQLYSTTKNSLELHTNSKDIVSLNPWFVTGFTDGDGSFSVSTAKKKSGTGWKIQPIFSIGLDSKDLDILIGIKNILRVGKIYTSKRGIIYYTVGSTKDIIKYILPHFDKYPLFSLKLKDYLIFKEIVLAMEKGEHRSLPGLLKIFSLRAILNKGLPEIVKAEFPNIKPATIPELKSPAKQAKKKKLQFFFNPILTPHWLSGFIAAEGSFFISLYPNEKRKAGYAVSQIFSLSQHIKDLELLELIRKYLACGTIRKHNYRESAELIITRSADINQKLIPLLSKYTLHGVKLLDFIKFKKASLLIENKMHLTSEGIMLINSIKNAMYKREL